MTDPLPVFNTVTTVSSSVTPANLNGFDIIISWMVSTNYIRNYKYVSTVAIWYLVTSKLKPHTYY